LIHVSDLSAARPHSHRPPKIETAMFACVRPIMVWCLVATVFGGAAARADSDDHDAVRLAVERGEIRSLAEILAALRGRLPGTVKGVEVERKGGRWVYEFRVADDKGRLFDVYVDARTGDIERTKEK
jgi:uncharacterized membrane protein YkoI